MNIVIDSNILFSALIKDSTTRRLILEYEGYFIFPTYILEELEKHQKEIQNKSGLTRDEFNQLLELLLRKVMVTPKEHIEKHKEIAVTLAKDIDINDVIFIATTLVYPNTVLWSDDKKLKQIKGISVFNTQEITKLLLKPK